MVIGDLNVPCFAIPPLETDPPLIVDANAVLASSITPQSFGAIARRWAQIIKPNSRVNHQELRTSAGLDLQRQAANGMPRKVSRRALVGKDPDQSPYLVYKPLPGAHLCYFAHAADGLPLALLGLGAAACMTARRGPFVGWAPSTRQRNLPWIRLPCQASRLLALAARRRHQDWHDRYRRRPALLETFCNATRFHGTCYRAANWVHVGQSQGRGKLDVPHRAALPVKHIPLKPILLRWRSILLR